MAGIVFITLQGVYYLASPFPAVPFSCLIFPARHFLLGASWAWQLLRVLAQGLGARGQDTDSQEIQVYHTQGAPRMQAWGFSLPV